MKVIYVVDTISGVNNKINLLKNNFGENIFYVVKADIAELFKTYGYESNAVYYKNLSSIIHTLLSKSEIDDCIVVYASLKFDNKLLNSFKLLIGDKTKVVSLEPDYNFFEQMCNSAYNVYVKSLFHTTDSLCSPKLQFLPKEFVVQLLQSHFSNRLFELNPNLNKIMSVDDKEINKSLKVRTKPAKYNIISLLIALVLTIGLLACIAYFKVNYIIILIFSILFLLDLTLVIIFQCKAKFDQRFLK